MNQIQLLQNELLKYQFNNTNNINNFYNQSNNTINISLKPGEKIMGINFVSHGNQLVANYNIVCKNTDLFVRLEEKLNNDFPQLKNYQTVFEVNTRKIKRFKTLDENMIKSNDVINIFTFDS